MSDYAVRYLRAESAWAAYCRHVQVCDACRPHGKRAPLCQQGFAALDAWLRALRAWLAGVPDELEVRDDGAALHTPVADRRALAG